MEEIKKSIIVFASVLKPADDTRMFEKMAQSLAQSQKYELHVIGYPPKVMHAPRSIFVHPLRRFKRISVGRLLAPVTVLRKVWRLNPALLIVNTHELLGVAFTMKALRGCKICYDIQENYFRNILYTNAFPFLLRPFIALYVRAKEISFSPFIDHFILAESGYEQELKYLPARKTVIENKLRLSSHSFVKKSNKDGFIHLLFSGTLAISTGVFEAVLLAKELHQKNEKIRLTLIGYCAQQDVLNQIKTAIRDNDFIALIGGDTLIPHQQILEEIYESDFGIISYPPNPSTENAWPTKLYEYLGCHLPVLLTDHKPWIDRCAPYPAAITVNFNHIDAGDILVKMETTVFYTLKPNDVFWEEEKFEKVIDALI
jgi:hypothetical protein